MNLDPLYEAFADVRRPGELHMSPVRDPADYAHLLGTPRRELTGDDLATYAFTAMTTVGDEDDFKWFLPALLQAVVTGDLHGMDLEIAVGKLDYAGWRDWPPHQVRAVQDVLDAWWAETLAVHPAAYPVDEVLCALGTVVGLAPRLAWWTASLGLAPAARHLADFAEHGLANAFWRPAGLAEVSAWLTSPALAARIEDVFLATADPAVRDALDRADRYLLAGPG